MIQMSMRRTGVPALFLAVLSLSACGPAGTQTRGQAATSPAAAKASPSASLPAVAPPVRYRPVTPDRTRKTARGYQVNVCVPRRHDPGVFTLTNPNGAHLSALELGGGERGILLAHEQGYNICSWLPLGEQLAAAGYHVMLFEYRNHGASEQDPDNDKLDGDVSVALSELHRRGAGRVLLAGASCGGTSSAVVAARESRLAGLLILSSPAQCGILDGEKAVRRITRPSFFAVSPDDYSGNMIKEVRKLYRASAAPGKHLEIVPGGRHGTDMLRYDHPERLQRLVRDFIDAAFGR